MSSQLMTTLLSRAFLGMTTVAMRLKLSCQRNRITDSINRVTLKWAGTFITEKL